MTRRTSRLANKMWRRRLTLELLERRDVPSFIPPHTFPAGEFPSAVAGADFDSDGDFDLVVTNQSSPGKVSLLLNQGAGIFETPKSFPAGGNGPSSLAVWDFNGNGTLDLAVTNMVLSMTRRISRIIRAVVARSDKSAGDMILNGSF